MLKQWDGGETFFKKRKKEGLYRALIGSGEQFENGFMTMGTLGLAMVGIMALAPVLAKLLSPFVIPLYQFIGASPAMFATTLLANDMGGFFLAKELATENGQIDYAAWLYAGLILGALLGPTLVFSIPVALGIIERKDHHFLAVGILAGLATIPIGCLTGGLVAKYSGIVIQGVPVVFTYSMILINIVPVILAALFVMVGLWLVPEKMIRAFHLFAKVLVCIMTIGLAAAVWKSVLGLTLIPGMDPIFMVPGDQPGQIMRAIEVVGYIACILLGAYPLVFLLTYFLENPLKRSGSYLQINTYATAGLLANLANNIPVFGMLHQMDNRGKVLNAAFCVSAAFTFGDHLGFTAANMPQMILAVIIAKLTGGITALIFANYIYNHIFKVKN